MMEAWPEWNPAAEGLYRVPATETPFHWVQTVPLNVSERNTSVHFPLRPTFRDERVINASGPLFAWGFSSKQVYHKCSSLSPCLIFGDKRLLMHPALSCLSSGFACAACARGLNASSSEFLPKNGCLETVGATLSRRTNETKGKQS